MRELTVQENVYLASAFADRWQKLAELRGQMLDELHAEMRRWEAHSVSVEDQRDKGFAERDTLIAAAMDAVHKGIAAYNAVIAERDALREQLNDLQAGMRQWEDGHASAVAKVIAERDALRKQLDDLRHDYTDKSYWGNT